MRYRIFLAALLHDIGKFYQRADYPFGNKDNKISEPIKKIVDYICPQNSNNRFGYLHTLWTAQFIADVENNILKNIPELGIKNPFDGNVETDSLFALAAYHHKPSSKYQAMISLADWWSAGIDRREATETEEVGGNNSIQWGNERYKRIPLYSIFNNITVKGDNKSKKKSAFKLHALTIDEENFFPKDINNATDGESQTTYAELWKQFEEEVEKLPHDSIDGFIESLLCLLKKYTWCIPSNTMDMANVSLYDHLKTTAAFADCIYTYIKDELGEGNYYKDSKITFEEGTYPVMLVGGDISGIQKFIYNIASRKAAVSLKGRSFYLQLLIDSVIHKITKHKDISATSAHVVYSSGGKFYMILPNTEKVKTALAEIKKEIEADLFEKHHGQLILNLDYIPFAFNKEKNKVDFCSTKGAEIGLLWRELADKLTNQKNQKFKSVISENFNKFFEVNEINPKAKICAVTGIESDNCVAIDDKVKDEDDKTYVLPLVKEQVELGNVLKDADFIVTHLTQNTEHKYLTKKGKKDIEIFGIHHYLFDQEELINNEAEFRGITSADTCKVTRINDTKFLAALLKGKGCGYGFQFYGGNKQAETKYNTNKTFDELADGEYLGILRMDVDNLGSIFIDGLNNADKSFSAYSTLSFMLDYFFSGYLNTIRNSDKYKNDVNILYSGGDDVFAVGKWDKLIEFAKDIRKNFEDFVKRPDITISGGIVLVGGKFPIAKAAELAGEAEDAAKKDNNGHKNSINLFGETIAWGKDFDFVENAKNEMIELYEAKSLTKGFLHKLQRYSLLAKENNLQYLWHSTYFLTRFMKDRHDNVKTQEYCTMLRDKILKNKSQFLLIGIAARWAELELREFNKNN